MDPAEFPYGVGQGALGIECRVDDTLILEVAAAIAHDETSARCKAERSFLRTLQGGCQVPIGVCTEVVDGRVHLRGLVLSTDGKEAIDGESHAPCAEAEDLGVHLARELMDKGARDLLGDLTVRRPITYGNAAGAAPAAASADSADSAAVTETAST